MRARRDRLPNVTHGTSLPSRRSRRCCSRARRPRRKRRVDLHRKWTRHPAALCRMQRFARHLRRACRSKLGHNPSRRRGTRETHPSARRRTNPRTPRDRESAAHRRHGRMPRRARTLGPSARAAGAAAWLAAPARHTRRDTRTDSRARTAAFAHRPLYSIRVPIGTFGASHWCMRDALFVFAGSAMAVVACAPRPDRTPASSRTIDSSGFVDNGGRTSEMHARTEASGMRATETGSDRTTGTPGSGLSITSPLRARTGGEARRTDRGDPGVPREAVVSRMAEAMCDHEAVCGRLGNAKRWRSARACTAGVREEAHARVDGCGGAFDATAVANCLGAIRRSACNAAAPPGECRTLCVP
jgi:hypothetical protein